MIARGASAWAIRARACACAEIHATAVEGISPRPFQVRGWALSEEEMTMVDGLDEGLHCNGDDPATML